MSEHNLILLTDSYKMTHFRQYPSGTEKVYSYFESRGGMFNETVFFGLQYYLKAYLEGKVVTKEKIDEADAFAKAHFGNSDLFNRKGWEYILKKHDGKLPISIKAVAEGTSVPVSNALMTVENTDPNCYWLTNYVETLLVQCWYGSTVATLSREMKNLILTYLQETGDPSLIDFKLHDFGFRGVSSVESAGIGGAAHLVNFKGTDTIAGIILADNYYGAGVCGFSIPASEHSTITSWGKENENYAYANMLAQFPKGLVACVSDSYDIYNACSRIWGNELRDKVLARDGTLVIRPDSGYPPEVVLRVLEILGASFGYDKNSKDYKVLNPKVRVIQGDGIGFDMTSNILEEMKKNGWSADNIAFGMGGGLLQKLDRDTQKFAFKCSSITVNGKEHDVFKSPITDPGKNSKKGRLKLQSHLTQGFQTVNINDCDDNYDYLVEVFRDGEILQAYSFREVRENAEIKQLQEVEE